MVIVTTFDAFFTFACIGVADIDMLILFYLVFVSVADVNADLSHDTD